MRSRLVVAAFALAVLPGLSLAANLIAPHDKADTNVACYYCHSLATSTASGTNYNSACLGCHNQPGHAFGSPWVATDEAVPGSTGVQHNWSGPGANSQYGAIKYLGYLEYYNQAGGNLQCIVCHNMHSPAVASPESMYTSIPQGLATPKSGTTGIGGSGQLTLTVAAGSGAKGFRVKIAEKGAGGGKFIISHDYAFNPDSWLNWNGTAWVSGTEVPVSPLTAVQFTDGVDVALDVAGVQVRWNGGYEVGDYWDFYVGYPFLRYTNVNDGICVGCHQERVMNHTRARGLDSSYLPNGVRKFSHPVGITLNANLFNTDRTTILDADGTPGSSSADGFDGAAWVANPTNDMKLSTGGIVRCTTCHSAHNADSNSLTVDVR